jgi:hypothetical protein
MEVLETKEEAKNKAEQAIKEEEVVKEISKAIHDAQDRVDARHADDDSNDRGELVANVDKHIAGSDVLSTVFKNGPGVDTSVADKKNGDRIVVVSDVEKEKFLDSVVSGKRYEEDISLMSGKLNVKFRSRSAIESEAIDAFLRDGVVSGRINNQIVYADTMRFCLLAAGVASLNGETFPTITDAAEGREHLFKTATKDGTKPPKWMWLYEKWRDMTEIIVAILIDAYFEYEAKYWRMIEKSRDENFWNAAESTGE